MRDFNIRPITRGLSWKAKHTVLKQNHELLSLKEKLFITDLHHRFWKLEYLSVKQTKWLNDIYNRLVFEHRVHYRAKHGGD